MKKIVVCFFVSIFVFFSITAQTNVDPKVLVLVEETKGVPLAHGRQIAQLLGHFNAKTTIKSTAEYKTGNLKPFQCVFYVGSTFSMSASDEVMNDLLNTSKTVVWINAGFTEFCKKYPVESKFGFTTTSFERTTPYSIVKSGTSSYTKGSPETYIVQVKDKKKVEVIATTFSLKPKKETPYIVKSKNLYYVADMPFTGANESDRYLLFSDKLHDFLGIKHPALHQAIIRIEDVTPLNDPGKLREVADIFAERGVPFLVGVVPFYVNPTEDRRVSLTDRPELVDALKYMVLNGGNIVMHGVTHQYKGISTDDAEFWNIQTQKPIPNENTDDIARKIELGIDEFFKNGLFPIAWETPHYVASAKSLDVISNYFSTVVEQRMVIDNFDYGQYFPYIIEKDMYGQKIYPENLGYVPLFTNIDSGRAHVNTILKNSQYIHQVSDGVISCFFHPFLNKNLLIELVDGIKAQGYTFIDLSTQTNRVTAPGKIILTGNQTVNLKLSNSFLAETYFDISGNITKKIFSPERLNKVFTKNVELLPGEIYVAEGLEYYVKEPTLKDKVVQTVKNTWNDYFSDQNLHEMRVSVLWNPSARGAAYLDQSSFVSIFKSINVNVDTIFINQEFQLENCNILVIPYASVDSLSDFEIDNIIRFVNLGGNLMTDRKNKLIQKCGIKFLSSDMKLHQIRDNYYPQEFIQWKNSQLANKFEYTNSDEIFCEDISTGLPVAIGKTMGKGKIIYFNTAFDPFSAQGYSNFPFALEYVKRYFRLTPVFKRENLEMYFDPGFRQNTSIETLVKLWVKQGIRIIHVAGWHQHIKNNYNYDYKRLIKLAHANGILVYAWIEPPQVSEKFWRNHPEWREKNYKGQDVGNGTKAQASWRMPVALTDERCLRAAMEEYIKLLSSDDWDGVNIAELYFEAGRGFNEPNLFTPMHPSALAEFKSKYGFDMRQVLDSSSAWYWKRNPKAKEDVVNYRVDKITSLHDRILKMVQEFAKQRPGFGIVVTFMDTYFSPEIREYHGVSSDRIVDLQKKYDIFLQPEDPQPKWNTDPYRYEEFGKYYASKMKDPSKLLVDLNILTIRQRQDVTPFPTMIQTGIESYQMIRSSALGAPRFTIYSESSCNPQDITMFSYASSAPVTYQYIANGYTVSSAYSFILQLPKNIRTINVDNQTLIGYRENDFLIPAGEHTITFNTSDFQGFSTVEIQPQLLSFTGNLLDIKYEMRTISFGYESAERAWASFNHKPSKVTVDDRDTTFEVLSGNDCFSISLPAGKHNVKIVTGDKFSNGINVTSLWSISAIAIYGTLAVIMLFIMYIGLKLFRKKLEN